MRHLAGNKIIGIVGMLFGLFCFFALVVCDKSKLIFYDAELFLVRYFLVIALINGGIGFIVFGALIYFGFLMPYFAKEKNRYEKAKHNALGLMISIPIWISTSAAVFMMSESIMWKTLWSLALIYIAWLLYSSVKVLQKGHKGKGGRG